MPYTCTNSHALTHEKLCINKGFHVLLMHRKINFIMIIPGPLQLFPHTPFVGHNTQKLVVCYPCFCNPPKNGPIKKKISLARSLTLFHWVRVHFSAHGAKEPLVQHWGMIISNTYHYYISILRHRIFVL